MKLVFTIYIALTFLSNDAEACSCRERNFKESYSKSELIISVKIITNELINEHEDFTINYVDSNKKSTILESLRMITAVVVRSYIGGNKNLDTIIILTPNDVGECGFHFRIDQNYIVYGRENRSIEINYRNNCYKKYKVYRTNICTRTREWNQYEAKWLLEEEEKKKFMIEEARRLLKIKRI